MKPSIPPKPLLVPSPKITDKGAAPPYLPPPLPVRNRVDMVPVLPMPTEKHRSLISDSNKPGSPTARMLKPSFSLAGRNQTTEPTPPCIGSDITSSSPMESTSQLTNSDKLYEPVGEEIRLRLSDIVTQPGIFPMRVGFCDSIYGFSGSFTFFSQEELDIHFMKATQFTTVKTSAGKTVKVPLQAPFKFSVDLDSPAVADVDCKMSQLFKLSYMPKVAIVKDEGYNPVISYLSSRNKFSKFTKGEVLILQSSPHALKSNTIDCVSISCDRESKVIHKSSEVVLTVNPSQLMFDFVDLKYFDLPLKAHIHVDSVKLQSEFPTSSTIIDLIEEKSLIASFSSATIEDHDDDNDTESVEFYEIFVDVPIDFKKIKVLQSERYQLSKKTKLIYENFRPNNISAVLSSASAGTYGLQKQLNEMVTCTGDGNELWKHVIKLYQPENLHQHEFNSPQLPKVQPGSITAYQTSQLVQNDSVPNIPQPSAYQTNQLVQNDIPIPLPGNVTAYQTSQPVVQNDVQLSPSTTLQASPLLTRSKMRVYSQPDPSSPISVRSSSLLMSTDPDDDSQLLNLPPAVITPKSAKKKQLTDLSCDEVLQLLDKLKLSQYKESFANEEITGCLLADLDTEVLERDLGMASKLHRIKLLQVIEGKNPISFNLDTK